MRLTSHFPGLSVETKVSIVGAGIIGCFLALKLAKNGIPCILIESNQQPELFPEDSIDTIYHQTERVVALTRASENLLKQVGCWQHISTEAIAAYRHMQVWSRRGLGEFRVNASEVQQPNLGHIVLNRAISSSLLQLIGQQPLVKVLWGDPIVAADSHSKHTLLTLQSGIQVKSQLCIGADGARSQLRSLLEIDSQENSYQQKAIVATVQMEQQLNNTAYQNFLDSGPLALLPLHAPDYGSIVWSADDAFSDRLMALDEEQFGQQLAAALDRRLGPVKAVRSRFQFPLVARQSAHYFKQSCVLVGDAAHTIHPLAGQGVNLGFQDAELLAGLITQAHAQAQPINQIGMLKRYQRQRKSEAQNMLIAMQGFKRCFGYQQPWWVALRSVGMKLLDKERHLKSYLVKHALAI